LQEAFESELERLKDVKKGMQEQGRARLLMIAQDAAGPSPSNINPPSPRLGCLATCSFLHTPPCSGSSHATKSGACLAFEFLVFFTLAAGSMDREAWQVGKMERRGITSRLLIPSVLMVQRCEKLHGHLPVECIKKTGKLDKALNGRIQRGGIRREGWRAGMLANWQARNIVKP
jgi:hypothetical protein